MAYHIQSGIIRMEEEAHTIPAWEVGMQIFPMDGRLFTRESIPVISKNFLLGYLKEGITYLPKKIIRRWKANGGFGNSQEAVTKDKQRREYQLVISKNAGSQIGCDQAVTVFAGIQERIYEEDGSMIERMNPDLSSKISFSSPEGFVVFSGHAMINDTKAVNVIVKSDEKKKPRSKEVTVSICYKGENGTHRQNITFRVAGQPEIRLPDQKLFIPAASGSRVDLTYTLVDFIGEVQVEVKAIQSDVPFDIKVDKDAAGQSVISVTDRAQRKYTEEYYTSYPCEITAFNRSESASTVFDVVLEMNISMNQIPADQNL